MACGPAEDVTASRAKTAVFFFDDQVYAPTRLRMDKFIRDVAAIKLE